MLEREYFCGTKREVGKEIIKNYIRMLGTEAGEENFAVVDE